MSKKFKELEEKEQNALQNELKTALAAIGDESEGYYIDNQFSNRGLSPNHDDVVGICAVCQYYAYAENNMHQIVHSRCDRFERNLGRNRIVKCSSFVERNALTLNMMLGMATLIDGNKKEKIGF